MPKKSMRFEDLRCWKAARELVKEVFLACELGKLRTDFEMRGQIKKAALSAMNNIAEGYGRYGEKDSIRFYDISQSSTREVLSMSYALEDLEYIPQERIVNIRLKAEETKNRTLAFIKHLRDKEED